MKKICFIVVCLILIIPALIYSKQREWAVRNIEPHAETYINFSKKISATSIKLPSILCGSNTFFCNTNATKFIITRYGDRFIADADVGYEPKVWPEGLFVNYYFDRTQNTIIELKNLEGIILNVIFKNNSAFIVTKEEDGKNGLYEYFYLQKNAEQLNRINLKDENISPFNVFGYIKSSEILNVYEKEENNNQDSFYEFNNKTKKIKQNGNVEKKEFNISNANMKSKRIDKTFDGKIRLKDGKMLDNKNIRMFNGRWLSKNIFCFILKEFSLKDRNYRIFLYDTKNRDLIYADFPIFADSDPVPLDYAEETHEIVLSILTTGQNARMCPIIIKLEKGLYE